MIPDHATITQEPDGLYHWQIVRLARGRISTSRHAYRTTLDAIRAAIAIAWCERLPLVVTSRREVTR